MPAIASPGARTAGGKAATYLLTGLGRCHADGHGPDQVADTLYADPWGEPTPMARKATLAIVNTLQDGYKVYPLSAQGKPYTFVPPPVDPNPGFSMTDKPQQVIDAMHVSTYYNLMARVMGDVAPPAPEDAAIVARMAKIGLIPGQKFDLAKFGPSVREALKIVPTVASAQIFSVQKEWGAKQNGWHIAGSTGAYGTDYLVRAFIAAFGWPANLPQDAVYPYATDDETGQQLTGASKYTLTFAKG